MVSPQSAPVDYIDVTLRTYSALGYPQYRWVHSRESPPFRRLRKPLGDCRLALVASGGVYVAGQIAFHHRDDTSYRLVPRDVAVADLRATHFAYDLADARRDPNVVFPIEPLRRLVAAGELGELAAHAVTFMGGIYSSRRVREELAPSITRTLLSQEVDIALLVPV